VSRAGEAHGQAALGMLFAVAAVALVVGAAAERLRPAASRRAVEASAEAVAARMRALSRAAVRDGHTRALVFAAVGNGEPVREAVDSAGDGIRRRGVAEGSDPAGAAYRLARDHPGVRFGRPAWSRIREIPPARGTIGADEPAVRFGTARMTVFDPQGHATSGSLFVTDGRDALCAVVVYGVTARVQVWCYDRPQNAWTRR